MKGKKKQLPNRHTHANNYQPSNGIIIKANNKTKNNHGQFAHTNYIGTIVRLSGFDPLPANKADKGREGKTKVGNGQA